MAVQVIKADRVETAKEIKAHVNGTGKTRVAAYCRVSTDSEEQETSYQAQCRHYTEFIQANPDWELVGIYADEGLSGTSTKKRVRFRQMIADCQEGLIDLVITKSISRWARNTVDSLNSIRKLKGLQIPIIFEKENINTMDAAGELLITIMSSLAQQESESISKNVRMGIQYFFQQGKGRLNTGNFLGLTRGEDGKTLAIVPEQAALVRRIYREYLEGFSPSAIARRLTEEKIPSPGGKATWYQSTVDSILRNEKYCGDLLMQKYYVVDVLTHKIAKNQGQLPQYFVRDAHEPIIPRQVFAQVQDEIRRRSTLKKKAGAIRMGSKIALQGRLICGKCGRSLKRYSKPDPMLTDWRCRRRAYQKRSMTKEVEAGCRCRNVNEREIKTAILAAFNDLPAYRDDLIRAQGAAKNGDMKRIDYLIENNRTRKERILERLTIFEETQKKDQKQDQKKERLPEEKADSQEKDFLLEELDSLEEESAILNLDRAEAAHREIMIRIILELADTMLGREGREINQLNQEGKNHQAACHNYDEFFRRTRTEIPEDIMDEDGKIIGFRDAFIIRYLDSVTVEDDGYRINFKSGLSMQVKAE